MQSVNGAAASSGEWRTAGKSKTNRSVKAGSQPSQLQLPTSGDTNDAKPTNGHAHAATAATLSENGSVQQNGSVSNDGRGTNRRGRQNGYNSRPRLSNATYSQSSRMMTQKEDALNRRKLIEKEIKNLSKHDAAAERVGRLFNEEIEKSQDRLHRAFQEMRQHLNEREKVMIEELERCKTEGILLLERGQERAKHLRDESERAPSMSDRQVSELRDEIRRCLAERRVEDELSRTIRFQFEPDRLISMIKNFGEVVPVGRGLQKRVSQTSLVSSLDDDGSSSGNYNAKPVSEVSSGGICMKSDSMSAEQLAQLTQHLKESLKLQGITEDILPDVSGVAGALPARRQPPLGRTDNQNGQNGSQRFHGRRGGRRAARGDGYRNGAETTRY